MITACFQLVTILDHLQDFFLLLSMSCETRYDSKAACLKIGPPIHGVLIEEGVGTWVGLLLFVPCLQRLRNGVSLFHFGGLSCSSHSSVSSNSSHVCVHYVELGQRVMMCINVILFTAL